MSASTTSSSSSRSPLATSDRSCAGWSRCWRSPGLARPTAGRPRSRRRFGLEPGRPHRHGDAPARAERVHPSPGARGVRARRLRLSRRLAPASVRPREPSQRGGVARRGDLRSRSFPAAGAQVPVLSVRLPPARLQRRRSQQHDLPRHARGARGFRLGDRFRRRARAPLRALEPLAAQLSAADQARARGAEISRPA